MRKFSIGRWGLVAGALLLMGGLAGCGGKQDIPETAPQGMSVDVDFHPVHRCSRLSPAIQVANVPRGTSYFDVRLVEMEPVERLLGGGTWSNDGSGKIAEGGLTKLYSGPCPPAGVERRYSYVISAMPFGGGQPLSVRTVEVLVEGQ